MSQQQPTVYDFHNAIAARVRQGQGQAGSFPLMGRFILGAKVTDNDSDVTRNSLLGAWDGSTGIADPVIREQLEATGANPKYSLVVTGLAIEVYPSVETQSVLRQFVAASFLAHKAAEDAGGRVRILRFADYITSRVGAVASGATAELTASTIANKIEIKDCPPFLLNMERDTFTSSSTYAVNSAADFLVLVHLRGVLAPNNVLNLATVEAAIGACGKAA